MGTPDRFTDMAAVKRERERLLAVRDERLADLNGHWARLREPELLGSFGGTLAKGMMRSMFSWSNAKQAAGLLSPELIGGIAGMALGGRAKSTAAKMLAMGLSAAIPFVAKRIRRQGPEHDVLSELDTSWERLKHYVRERRAARREGRSGDTQ